MKSFHSRASSVVWRCEYDRLSVRNVFSNRQCRLASITITSTSTASLSTRGTTVAPNGSIDENELGTASRNLAGQANYSSHDSAKHSISYPGVVLRVKQAPTPSTTLCEPCPKATDQLGLASRIPLVEQTSYLWEREIGQHAA